MPLFQVLSGQVLSGLIKAVRAGEPFASERPASLNRRALQSDGPAGALAAMITVMRVFIVIKWIPFLTSRHPFECSRLACHSQVAGNLLSANASPYQCQ